MIGFEPDAEEKEILALARRFARETIMPSAAACDETESFPKDVMQGLFDAGLLDPEIPVEAGGIGMSRWLDAWVTEELAWGCAGITLTKTANNLGLTPVIVAGTPEQKRELLGPFTEELRFAAFCLTEPSSGSDAASLRTRARRVSGGYVLDGTKRFITNGGVASLYTVFATIDPGLGPKGIVALAVPRETDGVGVGKRESKLGIRASDTTEVLFEGAFVPESMRLGEEGQGFRVAMKTLDLSRPNIAAGAIGIGRRAIDEATSYARERRQFGRPIIEHEGIAFLLADMQMEVEAAHWLMVHAGWLADQGQAFSAYASMAKAFGSDAAMRAATNAVQVFGGYGFMRDYPVEKLFRDAKIYQIFEGANQIQRLVIARWLAQR